MGLFVFIGITLTAVTQTDWQKDGLQGKVKTITDGFETTTYTQQGYIESFTTELGLYNDLYTYDAKGRLISCVHTDRDGEFSNRKIYSYDVSGLLIVIEYKDSFASTITKYEYNTKQQLTWIKFFDAYNILYSSEGYLYDTAGNNIRINNYEEDAKEPWSYTIFAYDKKNKLVEKREYERPDTEQPIAVYKYDAEGLLTVESRYHEGALDTRMSVFYDKYGNVTMNKVYFAKDDETNFTKFIYTYDKKGNWLTKEEFRDGKHNYKSERSITYY